MELEERFWSKADWDARDEERCWEWLAAKSGKGYGVFSIGAYSVYAHRIAYELEVGDIPDELVIDHTCRNRGCVNPAHLEPVTNAENLRRGAKPYSDRTACPKGHPYDADYGTGRRCRTCLNRQNREYKARRS